VQLEVTPSEREVLLQWNFTPEIRAQLEPLATSPDVETITLSRVDLQWLASDVTHAIVKRGCRDDVAIELSERLDYVVETGDGSLQAWYWD
jgi:hypothetical protein